MDNFQAYQYYNQIYNSIYMDICQPLFQGFENKVSIFGYLKMYNNSKYLTFSNSSQYIKHFLLNINDNGEIFSSEISKVPHNKFYYFPWPVTLTSEELQRDGVFSTLYNCDIWHGITCYKRSKEYVEAWYFAGNRSAQYITQLFLNNKEIFEHFIHYFNDKAESFINVEDDKKLAAFKNGVTIDYINDKELKKDLNISEFPLQKFLLKGETFKVSLSGQEFKCLYNFSNGKTMKETALELNISPRTVESHLNRIKLKTGINYKPQLIYAFKQNYK